MKLGTKISTFAVLCVALGSQALTLGPVQGTAVLGQALDVMVQVQLEAAEEASPLCFEAEVLHAEARQDGSKVRTLVERLAQSRMANVRVLSSALVDEPVVAITLRSICGPKISRRYVLFADLPEQGVVLASPPTLLSTPGPSLAASGPTRSAATPPPVRQPKTRSKLSLASEPVALLPVEPKRATEKPVTPAAPKPRSVDGKRQPARTPGAARLKLDPLDVLSDRIANLDSFMNFAPSEDALANIQKVKALEAEVKALRESALKNERALAEFKTRLQQTEAERSSSVVVYGLAGMVFCCVLAVLWLWNRQRGASVSELNWSDDHLGQTAVAPVELADPPAPGPAPKPEWHADDQSMSHGVDAQSVQLTDSIFSRLMHEESADHAGVRPAQPKVHARLMRSLNSDEILTLRAQAEDLALTGEPERALALLKKQISESDEPNPFVYLDLLTLLHDLNLKSDFQQCAQDFCLLFNGTVPEFAFFKDEGKGLESYPEVMSRVTEHWPTLKTLEVIEACVFRDPWATSSQPFDLAAMRDLMLLHGVAQSLVLAAIDDSADPSSAHAAVAEARPSQHAGLEFDYADSVASSFPALSKSALADLFGRQAERPAPLDLDLDLSALDMQEPSAALALQTEPALQLKSSGS
ncbi:MAG: hypothetical protein WCK94_10175 [Comamonadaceae bacterium]